MNTMINKYLSKLYSNPNFSKTMLLIIVILLLVLVWLNRYSYVLGINTEEGNSVWEAYKINNFTGIGCHVRAKPDFNSNKIYQNFTECTEIKIKK